MDTFMDIMFCLLLGVGTFIVVMLAALLAFGAVSDIRAYNKERKNKENADD